MKLAKTCVEYTLFLIFGTVFFQSIFFLLNLSVSSLSLLLATFAWLGYHYFLSEEKKDLRSMIFALVIVWIGIFLLNFYFSFFHETTYDGAYYHGNAIVEMLNGWNPFYEANNYEQTGVTIWADYYPKATWIFSAVLIRLTGSLSSGMILNTLVTLVTVVYAYLFLRKRKTAIWISVSVALLLFLNPITLEQTHTYYVDGLIGNLVALLLMLGIEIMEGYDWRKNLWIFIVSVLLINIKFSSFGFAGIINLFIWIYFLIRDRRHALHYMLFGGAMLVVGIFIIGFSPYWINLTQLRHIFYPIAGKDAQDVVTYLIPEVLVGKNPIYKLIYSTFGGTDIKANLLDFSAPAYLLYDERIGAFGNQFGKMVILSAAIYLVWGIKAIKDRSWNLPYFLAFSGLTVSIVANYQNIWWFRYAPQIWLYLCIAVWMTAKLPIKPAAWLILGLTFFQGFHIFSNTWETDYAKSRSIELFYQKYRGESITVQIKANDLTDIYWFDAYEKARAEQEGVKLTIIHDQPVKNPEACHFMHSYKICPIE